MARLWRISGQRRLGILMLAASVLGIGLGWACHSTLQPAASAQVASGLSLLTEAFLRLIKLIVAPLVLVSLASALAQLGHGAELRRVGLKTLTWFVLASVLSLAVGSVLAQWLQPGASLHLLAAPAAVAETGVDSAVSPSGLMHHLVPRSITEALGGDEMLQIVLIAVLLGLAAAALGERAERVVELLQQLAAIMFKITDYVMKCAPVVIFAALASSISIHGLGLIKVYASLVGGFYLTLLVLWLLLFAAAGLVLGRDAARLLAAIRQPLWLAFATSSSEAAYPRLLEQLVEFGVPRRIASFVLPLGYSFNLDGAMLYAGFALLFIAQAYAVHLSWSQWVLVAGVLLLSSKGLAGVPRAALAVIAVALPYAHLPAAGLGLVLAVDYLLDMGRSATNIVGNALAAAVVSASEGRRLQDGRKS